MRYRLGLGAQGGDALASGVGNGMRNLFALPMLQAQAAEQADAAGMKQKLMESQIAAHVADAALKGSQTTLHQTENTALAGAPDVFDTIIAGKAGTDVPTLRAWRDQVRTGVKPMNSATGDPETDAAIGIAPQPAVPPAVAQMLLKHFERAAPGVINPKALKMDDMAQAAGHYQTQDVLDQVLQGRAAPGAVGAAVAASKGNKQFDNVGNTGVGYNVHTGQGAVIDQGLRTLFGDEGQALVTQRRAAAGASGASAGLANARRERVVGGYDKPVTILDDDSGEASVTRIPTGAEPVTIGLAAKKKTGTDATNAKERNKVVTAVEKEFGPTAKDSEVQAEVTRRMARREAGPATKPPAAAAPPAEPKINLGQAAQVRADFKAGKITRDEAKKRLNALGFQ